MRKTGCDEAFTQHQGSAAALCKPEKRGSTLRTRLLSPPCLVQWLVLSAVHGGHDQWPSTKSVTGQTRGQENM